METEKQNLLEIISALSKNYFKLVTDLFSLASAETRLAGRSLLNLVPLYFLLGLFITTTWVCILGIILLYLFSSGISLLVSLSLVTAINFLVLGVVVLRIAQMKRNLHFTATRRQLHHLTKSNLEVKNGILTSEN